MMEKIRNTIGHKYNVWRVKWFIRRRFRWLGSFARKLCQWRTLNNTFIFILLIGLGGMLILVVDAFLIWRNTPNSENSHESVRNLIYAVGGVGAAIGLLIATQRQKTFSDQVQVHVDQSFNDKLGRGVELLADENVVMRSAGVRVLVDLADSATDVQKPIVANIIHDFFRNKMRIKYNKNGKRLSTYKTESCQDLQNALDFLINISLDERRNMYQDWLHVGRLDFRNLNFNGLSFADKTLNRINFSKCCISSTIFENANIEYVSMDTTEINDSQFSGAKIINSHFFHADIKDSDFSFAEIEKTSFSNVGIVNVDFLGTKFHSGYFSTKSKIKISEQSDLPYFIFTNIEHTEFDFDSKFEPKNFFELCYYSVEDWASAKNVPMDSNRGYEFDSKKSDLIFVKSEKPWSGQPMQQWMEVEMAQWKLEQIKSLQGRRRDEEDVTEAKAELEYAMSNLREYQKRYILPKETPQPTPKPKSRLRSNPKPKAKKPKPPK